MDRKMEYLSGHVYGPEGFFEGHVAIEDGTIVEVNEGLKADADVEGVILPTLVNAHVHLGDAFLKPPEGLSLAELVAPPDGWKHRMLREAEDDDVIAGIREAVERILMTGTSIICDFREGGIHGIELLETGLEGFPGTCHAFGRPAGLKWDTGELDGILAQASGIGVSGIGDWDLDDLRTLARETRTRGGRFGIHASEGEREDIEAILALEPDFLVHMSTASVSDLRECADAGVPIVVCPGTNQYFGRRTNIDGMVSAGVTVALGSDNAMLNPPSMWREMWLARQSSRLSKRELLRICIDNGRKVIIGDDEIGLAPGKPADLVVVAPSGDGPTAAMMESDGPPGIRYIRIGDWTWTP